MPGDEIIGYITRGYGVSVHKFSCPHAQEGLASPERDRWINASWAQNAGEEKSHTTYNATLLLLVADNIGVMASISTALAEMRIPISAINTQASSEGTSLLTITIGIKGRDHLNAIIERLKKNKEILQIRVGGEK